MEIDSSDSRRPEDAFIDNLNEDVAHQNLTCNRLLLFTEL